jgi:glycosyltransferase involved in cell wall biosynthesis
VSRLQPDCLYLNTLVLGYALGGLRFEPGTEPAVISHGHEMELGLMLSSQPELVTRQLALSHHVIACAEAVREHLSERYQLPPTACTVIPEYIPYSSPAELQGLRCADASQAVIDRLQHWRRQGVFLFGFAGSPIDRKGFDLFPQLVKACLRRFGATPFKAVWVGCAEGSRAHTQAARDLRLLGVEEQALLLPGVSCGAAALAELQALALLSREDPYPVVALEAGALAVPTVCFRGSGGIASLVEQGVGLAVDYLDLDAFAAALHRLQQKPALRQQLGQQMQAAVFSGHTLEQAGPAIAAQIEAQIAR